MNPRPLPIQTLAQAPAPVTAPLLPPGRETTPAAAASPNASGSGSRNERLRRLSEEFRCLVCQNQTLADSNADLAVDLKRRIDTLLAQGRSDAQIRDYMVARYGDFVLYRPPLQKTTWLLWFGPFSMLAGGGLVWWMVQRRHRIAADRMRSSNGANAANAAPPAPAAGGTEEADPGRLARARALLDR